MSSSRVRSGRPGLPADDEPADDLAAAARARPSARSGSADRSPPRAATRRPSARRSPPRPVGGRAAGWRPAQGADRRPSRCRRDRPRRRTTLQRVVARAPHEPVDRTLDAAPHRFGGDRDHAGRGHQRARSARRRRPTRPRPATTPVYTTAITPASTSQPMTSWVIAAEPDRIAAAARRRSRQRAATAPSRGAGASRRRRRPGTCQPNSNASGTTASQAATEPAASQPRQRIIRRSTSAPPPTDDARRARRRRGDADAAGHDVDDVQSRVRRPGDGPEHASRRCSAAVAHQTISIGGRRPVARTPTASAPRAPRSRSGCAQRRASRHRAPGALPSRATTRSSASVDTARINAASADDEQAHAQAAIAVPGGERRSGDQVDGADDEPGDDPPVLSPDRQSPSCAEAQPDDGAGARRRRTSATRQRDAQRSQLGRHRRAAAPWRRCRSSHLRADRTPAGVPSGWYLGPDLASGRTTGLIGRQIVTRLMRPGR